MDETLGIFRGVDSNFFVRIENGVPMIKVQNGVKIGHLNFSDVKELDLLIEQLKTLKEYFIEKCSLSAMEEKKLFGNLA